MASLRPEEAPVTMADHNQVSPHPFDAVAHEYDQAFSQHKIGRWLRAAVWEELSKLIQPGDHWLELGCGTGLDAVWLADQGVEVTATDASAAMVGAAERRIHASGLTSRVHLRQLDFSKPHFFGNALQRREATGIFNGVFSNFGGLNCLPDRRQLAAALYPWVLPGGKIVFVVMGPLCAWEILWHLAHGQISQALRRFRPGMPAHIGGGAYVRAWYPTPALIKKEFARYFTVERLAGLGFFLPPPYLHPLAARFPRLFQLANQFEGKLRATPPWPWLSDHYLVVLRRK